ncbi:MAG: cyclic nucleotide-binding domain-containing protein [Chthoniobacterales bacterium]
MTPPDSASTFEGPNLPAVGLVSELSDDDRAMLSSYGQFGFIQPLTTVIKQGTPQDRLYFVITGMLHAKREDDGHETLLSPIGRGEWFGEINIFDPAAASATVSAVDSSQIWSIGREELLVFLGAYPEAAVQIMIGIATIVSRRLRSITEKLVSHAEYETFFSKE